LVRELEVRAHAQVSLLTERRASRPRGLAGGEDGAAGENTLLRDGAEEALPAKVTVRVRPGDAIRIATPGGGGWGAPAEEGAAGASP
ncbi:MAG TPA: hydantoinase B/oxoprolinase family protein, partial [Longimicrobiales bacterium]|nr:hydantoinase B/oxoprolinase family protein [Longimicrobiales bacterium]